MQEKRKNTQAKAYITLGLLAAGGVGALGMASFSFFKAARVESAQAEPIRPSAAAFNIVFDPGAGAKAAVLQAIPFSGFDDRPQKTAFEGETHRGVSLKDLVDDVTKPLTPEDRAHVDLIVFSRADTEQKLLLPRALISKFPGILLSESKGKIRLVLPKEIYPKLQSEGILVESFGSREVTDLTLTSYDHRYGAFLLKRRTDPAAMRGEKLYVQNCLGCHSGNQLKSQAALTLVSPEEMKKFLTVGKHANASGVSKWSEILDQKRARSLASYVNAYQGETSTATAAAPASASGGKN